LQTVSWCWTRPPTMFVFSHIDSRAAAEEPSLELQGTIEIPGLKEMSEEGDNEHCILQTIANEYEEFDREEERIMTVKRWHQDDESVLSNPFPWTNSSPPAMCTEEPQGGMLFYFFFSNSIFLWYMKESNESHRSSLRYDDVRR
jgi:hypothetical protein